jgi:hypothetical protein
MKLEFLPPYSPDYNPIEEGFSATKAWIRRNGNQVRHALNSLNPDRATAILTQAVCAAMTPQNAAGWFGHSGYI